jgi:hypothetical protein
LGPGNPTIIKAQPGGVTFNILGMNRLRIQKIN